MNNLFLSMPYRVQQRKNMRMP